MKYDQLCDAAKQKAIAWYSQCEGQDWDGSQNYDDLLEGLKYLGIEPDSEARGRTHGGKTLYGPAFNWSGFYSQGDGFVFAGRWRAEDMDIAKLAVERGDKSPLLAVGAQLMLILLKHPKARCKVVTRHYGPGLPLMQIDDAFTGEDDEEGHDIDMSEEDQDRLKEAMEAAASACWEQLRDDYEWCTSEEQAIEGIAANEYTFDEDGDRDDSDPQPETDDESDDGETDGCTDQLSTT